MKAPAMGGQQQFIIAASILMLIYRGLYLRQPILTKLPVEIILCIMEELDSPTDLMSLILTARFFNDLWKRHTFRLSTAVLSNCLNCFAEPAKLLEEALYPEHPVGFQAAIARHTRMLRAAQYISYMYGLFKLNYCRTPYPYKDQDRAWFEISFYFLWYHVVTASYKPFRFLHQHRLDDPFPLPPDDSILTLCELIVWIRSIQEHKVASNQIFRRAAHIYRRRSSRDNHNNNSNNNHTNNKGFSNSNNSNNSPKKRLSQSKRWSICCAELWYHPWFEEARKDYWISGLRLHTLEPRALYPRDMYFNARPRLLGFLAWAREARVWRMKVERVLWEMGC